MQLTFREHPVAASLICGVLASAYVAGYFTEGHTRASATLRAAPYSFESLMICGYKWSGDFTRICYFGRTADGWRFVRAHYDSASTTLAVD
jgi:hypothetical protein